MANPDAVVNIGADGSAFSRAMQDIAKNTDTMANSIGAQLARVGQAFNGLATVGHAAARAVSAVTAPAAEIEDAAAALSVMLGNDTAAAKDLAVNLQLMAANGKIGMEDLFGAARALSNVYKDKTHLEHWVGVFADIAAGSKVSASRLGEFVARLNDTGKVELNELANAGIPIFEALGRVTGKNTEELRKMGAAGEISTGQLLAAFKALTAEGGKYHELNATLSNTTKGSFDTLSASISACAGMLGAPINDAMRPILQELAALLQEMRPQMEDVAEAVGKFFQGAATLARPLIDALGWIAGIFTSTEKLVGYAAAALLVWAASANRAAASTFSFGASIGSLWGKVKAMRLGSMFTGFSGMMATAKRGFAGMCAFMSLSWKSLCVSMAVAMRAAAVAIKTALISTGIGALIWAAGEALAALYSLFTGADEEAKRAAKSARAFTRELDDLKKAAASVENEMDMQQVVQQAENKLADLKDDIADALEEDEEEKATQLEGQRRALQQWLDKNREVMAQEVKRKQLEAERTRIMEEQKRLAEETAKAEAERWNTIQQMRGQRYDTMFERDMDETRAAATDSVAGSKRVIMLRLDRVGMKSVEELEAAVRQLENVGNPAQWQLERYQQLVAVLAKVDDELRRIDQAERAASAEDVKRKKNYYERRHTYAEGKEEERYSKLDVRGQRAYIETQARIAGYWGKLDAASMRAHLDDLASAGAKDNEHRIAQMEKLLKLTDDLAERRRRLKQMRGDAKTEMRIQALEATGQQAAADRLRAEFDKGKRVRELREAGYTEKQAEKQAGMEAKLREAQALRERLQSGRTTWVQTSLASVGGGVSRRLGTGQLAEAKKHSKLLKEIRDALNGKNGVALLA